MEFKAQNKKKAKQHRYTNKTSFLKKHVQNADVYKQA